MCQEQGKGMRDTTLHTKKKERKQCQQKVQEPREYGGDGGGGSEKKNFSTVGGDAPVAKLGQPGVHWTACILGHQLANDCERAHQPYLHTH